jgi:hypothetical protein
MKKLLSFIFSLSFLLLYLSCSIKPNLNLYKDTMDSSYLSNNKITLTLKVINNTKFDQVLLLPDQLKDNYDYCIQISSEMLYSISFLFNKIKDTDLSIKMGEFKPTLGDPFLYCYRCDVYADNVIITSFYSFSNNLAVLNNDRILWIDGNYYKVKSDCPLLNIAETLIPDFPLYTLQVSLKDQGIL